MVKPLISQGEKAPKIEKVRSNEFLSQKLLQVWRSQWVDGPSDIPIVIILIEIDKTIKTI
jgi:hypothetical protein